MNVQYLNRLDQDGFALFTIVVEDPDGIIPTWRQDLQQIPLPVSEADIEAHAEKLVERIIVGWNAAQEPEAVVIE